MVQLYRLTTCIRMTDEETKLSKLVTPRLGFCTVWQIYVPTHVYPLPRMEEVKLLVSILQYLGLRGAVGT